VPIGWAEADGSARFYAILIAATTIGVALNFTAIDPVKAHMERGDQRRDLGAHHGVMMLNVGRPEIMGRLHREAAPENLGWLAPA